MERLWSKIFVAGGLLWGLAEGSPGFAPGIDLGGGLSAGLTRIVVAEDARATEAFKPRAEIVRSMVREGLTALTGKTNETEAWLSMVNPEDVVGIKVFSTPGPDIGTRPAVVEAVVEGLKEAGIPAEQIVVWDKRASALRRAGFFEFANRLGIRVVAGELAGYDEEAFYETSLVGTPAFGDHEFGRTGDGVGRKSYFTKLVTGDVTRIISIAPLLNHHE
ncbi:MAG TPA: hypothetical protein VMS21_09525, partial [Methylomirabilota bacterium]|nr:hypothetical protein [Methylomirabilota bacterium]